MNKRQKKKFKKKGYHRKCLGQDEIVFLGKRCRKVEKTEWIWEKSKITPLTPDEIKKSFKELREWAARDHVVYKEFLKEDDKSEQASEEEV